MGWVEDLKAKYGGVPITTSEPSTSSNPSWVNKIKAKYDLVNAPANFTPQTTKTETKPATPTSVPAASHPNSVVFKDYKAPPKETISQTPLTGLTQSLNADKPTDVTINGTKTTVPALYPTTFGRATDNPTDALSQILGVNTKIDQNTPTWQKPFLAAGQSILGGIGNVAQSLKDVYETAKQAPTPGAQGAFEDTAKIFNKMLMAGTSVFFEQPEIQSSMAVLQGVAQVPAPNVPGTKISTNPAKSALDLMDATQKGAYNSIMAGADALNVPDSVKQNIVSPIAQTLSTVAMMLILKHGEEIPGFAIEKSPIPEGIKAPLKSAVKGVTTFAVDPLRAAQDFMHAAAAETKQFQDAGVPVDENIGKKIVSDTAKKVPLPNDTGAVKIQTPNGEVVVHSDNATVLQNLIKDHQSLDFKKVENLTDANGNPITARFTWDFENQKGTMEVTDATTAVNLSHEIGHIVDADLKAGFSKILSKDLPNYLQNKAVVDRMVMDMAVGNLDGNGTVDQIRTEAVKVANELAAEAKQKAATVKRQVENKAFLTSLGDTAKNADETTPTLSKMVDFAKGKDVFAKEQPTEKSAEKGGKSKQENLLKAKVSEVAPEKAVQTKPPTAEELKTSIDKQVEEFRQKADLMASNEGAGVRHRTVTDANGNPQFVANDFKLSRAKGDMHRRAEDMKKEAHALLYENDPAYRKLVDDRDALLEKEADQVKTPDAVDELFGLLSNEITKQEADNSLYAQTDLRPDEIKAAVGTQTKIAAKETGVTTEVISSAASEVRSLEDKIKPLQEQLDTNKAEWEKKNPSEMGVTAAGDLGFLEPKDRAEYVRLNDELSRANKILAKENVAAKKAAAKISKSAKVDQSGIAPEVSNVTEKGIKATDNVSHETNINKKGTTVSKVASDINKTLVEKGLKELPEDQLAKITSIEKENQIKMVTAIMEDPMNARDMVLGYETIPDGVHPQVLFNAVKNWADINLDGETLIELAKSPIAIARSEAAQTLSASGFNNNPNDAMSKIQEVMKAREAAFSKDNKGQTIEGAIADAVKEIKQFIPKTSKGDLGDFIDSITC